jgi:hypothetical protein
LPTDPVDAPVGDPAEAARALLGMVAEERPRWRLARDGEV